MSRLSLVAAVESWLCAIEPVSPKSEHRTFKSVRQRVARAYLQERARRIGADLDRISAAGCPEGPRVLLGSAESSEEGYIAVDRRPVADLAADVRELPFADGVVAKIAAFDILEHFWKDETQPILTEWRRVLRPGGHLAVRVPNIVYLAQLIRKRIYLEDAVKNVYGGHRWGETGELDTHHWGWTPAMMTDELEAAGFCVFSNDYRVNMTLEAVTIS